MKNPIDIRVMIKEKVEKITPATVLTDKSGEIGSSYIAYDICKNKKNKNMNINVLK